MASIQVLQNTPTPVDLVSVARSTGWSIDGNTMVHEACNAGYFTVNDFIPVIGQGYTISYQVTGLTSGSLRMSLGDSLGIERVANGNYTEQIIATGANPRLRFYSDGNLRVSSINRRVTTFDESTKKRNTIVFNEKYNKWPSFWSFTSDFGVSLYKDLFTFKQGRLYRHDPDLPARNVIYGVQYKTILNFVSNAELSQPKTFESLSYEANQLMITTAGGIKTSLGQISELVDEDFLKDTLEDGVDVVQIFDVEGIYSASFWRDMREESIIDGDELKGTYISVELIQDSNALLILKNVRVHSEHSAIGAR